MRTTINELLKIAEGYSANPALEVLRMSVIESQQRTVTHLSTTKAAFSTMERSCNADLSEQPFFPDTNYFMERAFQFSAEMKQYQQKLLDLATALQSLGAPVEW